MRVLRRIVDVLFSNRVGTAVARRTLPVLDRLTFTMTSGRQTFVGLIEPALVLESIGARSGLPRQNPLLYIRDGYRRYREVTAEHREVRLFALTPRSAGAR